MKANNQRIQLPILDSKKITLYIKREDIVHPTISGNKYRKLKYNVLKAKQEGHSCLLTFGGAFSNHVLATAIAAKEHGLNAVGIIRGEELTNKWRLNPTLLEAHKAGMEFKFVSRAVYKDKMKDDFLRELRRTSGPFYLLPEGGTNSLAVKGCEEILRVSDSAFNYICCSVGTGGTLAGLINSSNTNQQLLGFPALKGNFLQKDICKFVIKENWELIGDYHFGGYAKINAELVNFINAFNRTNQIQLDPVYTAKMLYGIVDLIGKGYFKKNSKVLAIHTGGLQGITGMNMKLKEKNLPLINI